MNWGHLPSPCPSPHGRGDARNEAVPAQHRPFSQGEKDRMRGVTLFITPAAASGVGYHSSNTLCLIAARMPAGGMRGFICPGSTNTATNSPSKHRVPF